MSASGSARDSRPIRVAVAGGGPAGTFFSYRLCRMAREAGRRVTVTIFEPKTFEKRGAFHCNYCQGVISSGLLAEMKKLGLWIPEQVIRAKIKSYGLVTIGGEIRLPVPDGQNIFTVFRGHGPVEEAEEAVSFDQFLLDRAIEAGALKVPLKIERVVIVPGSDNPVTIIDHHGAIHQADLIVGAFGVNSDLGEQFEQLCGGYRRPRTDNALQAEYRYDTPLDGDPGQEVKIFALGMPQVRFAVVTPKRSHATVSLIGAHLSSAHMERFITHPLAAGRLSPRVAMRGSMRCSCAPRMPVNDGGTLAGAHWMVIGDAAVSRYYKNGIESALRSAVLAADTIGRYGPADGAVLRRKYSDRVKRMFGLDNLLGRLLFAVHDRIYRWPSVAAGYLAIARGDYGLTGHSRRKLRWILWNMFTGDASYSRIFVNCLDPLLLARIVTVSLRIRLIPRQPVEELEEG